MSLLKIVKDHLEDNPDPVEYWLSRVRAGSRNSYRSAFNLFLKWLQAQPNYSKVAPSALLLMEAKADNPYKVLGLLQKYIQSLKGTVSRRTKDNRYRAVHSFFEYNRCSLPKDKFTISEEESKETIEPKLTIPILCDMLKAANLRDKSIILCKWQSLQDGDRLAYIGQHCGDQIIEQMRQNKCPIRIDLKQGRKGSEQKYYCFIGADAINSLREYFDKVRGWPARGEPLWLKKSRNKKFDALTKTFFGSQWNRILERIGLIKRATKDKSIRYGYGAHETRDLAKSLLHTRAVEHGFDMDCAVFCMGHGRTLDKNRYDKFYKDEEYVSKQYGKAEAFLNLVSNPPLPESMTETVETQRKEMKKLANELHKLQLRIFDNDITMFLNTPEGPNPEQELEQIKRRARESGLSEEEIKDALGPLDEE